MRTPTSWYTTTPTVYPCALQTCPRCDEPLVACHSRSGRKVVHTMTAVLTMAYRPKRCVDPQCPGPQVSWPSTAWQQIAPWPGTYGYDVLAHIGWQRQQRFARLADIPRMGQDHRQISAAHVRSLYHQPYLPLLACLERQEMERLQTVAEETGLMVGLDGLAPEGGEPQLWLVRALQPQRTLRCGWRSTPAHATLVHLLQPIRDLGWPVVAVMREKQHGLVPAVQEVFPQAKHACCPRHSLKHRAAPVAEADEKRQMVGRKDVRSAVGELIRHEQAPAAPGVLTVTGLLPSPVPLCPPDQPGDTTPASAEPPASAAVAEPRDAIVHALLRRVRSVLTLKGRPPLRLAGIERCARRTAVATCLDRLLQHHADTRLLQLRQGLRHALETGRPDYTTLRQAADWLHPIEAVLDPQGKPVRSAADVHTELWDSLDRIHDESVALPSLQAFSTAIRNVTSHEDSGL